MASFTKELMYEKKGYLAHFVQSYHAYGLSFFGRLFVYASIHVIGCADAFFCVIKESHCFKFEGHENLAG